MVVLHKLAAIKHQFCRRQRKHIECFYAFFSDHVCDDSNTSDQQKRKKMYQQPSRHCRWFVCPCFAFTSETFNAFFSAPSRKEGAKQAHINTYNTYIKSMRRRVNVGKNGIETWKRERVCTPSKLLRDCSSIKWHYHEHVVYLINSNN